MHILRTTLLLAVATALPAAGAGKDLASAVQGTYTDEGKGTVTVTRLAADRVRVSSSDGRIPATEVKLRDAGGKVVQAEGDTSFTVDRGQHPPHLDVATKTGARWSGRKLDLADAAQGTYAGNVISDSKGATKNDVTLTVTRIGENRVRITSDYPRLPTVEVGLTLAMGKILSGKGDTAFVLDRSAKPAKLDVSFHQEVSWSGTRRP